MAPTQARRVSPRKAGLGQQVPSQLGVPPPKISESGRKCRICEGAPLRSQCEHTKKGREFLNLHNGNDEADIDLTSGPVSDLSLALESLLIILGSTRKKMSSVPWKAVSPPVCAHQSRKSLYRSQ